MDSFNDRMRHVKINDIAGLCLHSGSLCPDVGNEIKWRDNINFNTEAGSVTDSSICLIKYPE